MSNVAIVFWSGTGNTEAMANSIAEGVKAKGASCVMMAPTEFSTAQVGDYDAIAFGCPSMGSEVLEECEFQPMWDDVMGALSGKNVVLFGSYGWGDGEWMRNWVNQCEDENINVLKSIMVNEAPDAAAQAECVAAGEELAG